MNAKITYSHCSGKHRWVVGWAVALTVAFLGRAAHAGKDYPIRPVPLTQVALTGGFWADRIESNRQVTIPYVWKKCEETGRISNFAVAGGLKAGEFQGIYFNDSDVFKVIEGVAYSLTQQSDAKLEALLDDLIVKIAAAQEDDGYLYTFRTIKEPNSREKRWLNLASSHELYNLGHLYEAAVAHWQATGKRTLLDVAVQSANLVCRVFGPEEGQRIDVPGHEEIEIGLVKLYRATGDEKYLRQAKFFIDMRGRADKRRTYGAYCQDHKPVVLQDEAVGHAVRATYLYAGVADVAALTGDADYVHAIDRLWENIVFRKMYLTGGIGATRHGEAFGRNYQLPNDTAYSETCAAIALALLNHRMFLLHGDGKYIDVLERIIYNGFLAGVSLTGDRFFYPNPLAADGYAPFNQGMLGRSPWFDCACCPVNIVRFMPAIAGYVYAARDNDVYVNLFAGGSGKVPVGQSVVTIRQQTRYPWEGLVRIEVEVAQPTEFALHVRIPGWCLGQPVPGDLYRYVSHNDQPYTLRLNGQAIQAQAKLEKGYAVISRRWQTGDAVELELPMPVNFVEAHANVVANRGRVAVERGPLLYCFEAIDNDGAVENLVVPPSTQLTAKHSDDLLGGVTVLTGPAQRALAGPDGASSLCKTTVTAIPYYAWAHRHPGAMAVWIAADAAVARALPPSTLASTSSVSASHIWQNDTPAALHDQIAPTSSNDRALPRLTWWDHRGTPEWVQYDFAHPSEVREVEVYWFDDTGMGECRVPQAWRLVFKDGDAWKPAENLDPYGVEPNRFNRVSIAPVKTTALRLEVQLQQNFSAGVLEWRAK